MKRTYWGFIRTAILGMVLALIITSLAEPAKVEGTSMEPAVMAEDTIILNKASYLIGEPAYGDIVVFEIALYTEDNVGRMLVKRVVAVAGDTVEIKDGVLYRNDTALSEEYVSSAKEHENMEAVRIEPGYVFVMGDNRAVSRDSRDEIIGPVAVKDILGKVAFRVLPMDHMGKVS